MTAKQISLTDEEIAAILTALRVRINDLHRLADNLNTTDDPGISAGRPSTWRSLRISLSSEHERGSTIAKAR